jgi:hypothetical protein
MRAVAPKERKIYIFSEMCNLAEWQTAKWLFLEINK